MNLLLIEDEPSFVKYIVYSLGQLGCVVFDTNTLRNAIDHLKKTKVDAILLDLSLPNGQGVDLVKAIKEVAKGSPIVILTASGEDRKPEMVLAGASEYLVKGDIKPEEIISAVKRAIEVAKEFSSIEQNLERIKKLGSDK